MPKFTKNLTFLAILLSLGLAAPALAKTTQTLFDVNIIADQEETGIFWRFANTLGLEANEDNTAVRLIGEKEVSILSPPKLDVTSANQLRLSFLSTTDLDIGLNTNIRELEDGQLIGDVNYRFNYKIKGGSKIQQITFPLQDESFGSADNQIMIKFTSPKSSDSIEVDVYEIIAEDLGLFGLVGRATKDYFKFDQYMPYTVNLMPTPEIFGQPAGLWFAPIVLVAAWFILRQKKYTGAALIVLAVLLVAADLRAMAEFSSYTINDTKEYVQPKPLVKNFRADRQLAGFTSLLNKHIQPTDSIRYLPGRHDDSEGKLRYALYPTRLTPEAPTIVVYRNPDIKFNSDDKKLYENGEAISATGILIDEFAEGSFIFREIIN